MAENQDDVVVKRPSMLDILDERNKIGNRVNKALFFKRITNFNYMNMFMLIENNFKSSCSDW